SAHLDGVIDPVDKRLKTEKRDYQRVLPQHYQRIFGTEEDEREPAEADRPAWHDAVFGPKAGVDRRWYEGVTSPYTEAEVLERLARFGHRRVAPGFDRVSSSLLNVVAQGNSEEYGNIGVQVILGICNAC